ncbi:MAG: hypothetical protein FWC43_07465 [Planctomycetaceae bacterium]|nr:hypothetical protein [Planctomycetaceae bacterium]
MKDRTRHSLAVLLFLVFGPTLTAALVGWVALRRSPLAVQAETSTIRTGTGIDLKINSVEYRRWNLWKYGQMELPHPNTGRPLVVFSDLENRLLPSKISKSSSLFSLFFPEINTKSVRKIQSPFVSITLHSGTDLAILGDFLLNQFGDRFADRKGNVVFNFDEIEIHCPAPPLFRLRLVEGHFYSENGKSSLECSFNFQENPSQEPVLFTITRQKGDSDAPELLVELRTETTAVPVRFLALLFPGLKSLGPESFFHGTVRGELLKKNTWVVTFEDMTIENADLKTLGAELTPYRLSGRVNLMVKSARIARSGNQSRFLDGSGWVQIENGSIERKLLAQLIDDWQLSPTPNDETNPLHQWKDLLELLPRERQDVAFVAAPLLVFLGKDGISLCPVPKNEKSGLIMEVDKEGFYKYHLPKQNRSTPIPYWAFFRSFSPPNAEFFPLTPQVQKIVPYLFQP